MNAPYNLLRFCIAIALSLLLGACASRSSKVAVLVEVPRPATVTNAMLDQGFMEALPRYQNIPGLAMSRSFGDMVAGSVGCISTPEIFEYEITKEDKFMILASDGIWEFITSSECISIISEYYERNSPEECMKYLYELSSERWIEDGNSIDDITMILIFFNK